MDRAFAPRSRNGCAVLRHLLRRARVAGLVMMFVSTTPDDRAVHRMIAGLGVDLVTGGGAVTAWIDLAAEWVRGGRVPAPTGEEGLSCELDQCPGAAHRLVSGAVHIVPDGTALAGADRGNVLASCLVHRAHAGSGWLLYAPACGLAAKGGVTSDITVEDVLELADIETVVLAGMDRKILPSSTDHCGIRRSSAPKLPPAGQSWARSGNRPEKLFDRYRIEHRPRRNPLVDRLRERQPHLDCNSLQHPCLKDVAEGRELGISVASGALGAARVWVETFTGLRMPRFSGPMAVRERGGDGTLRGSGLGRPPLAERVLWSPCTTGQTRPPVRPDLLVQVARPTSRP